MNTIETEILNEAEKLDPNAPAVEIAKAAMTSAVNPSPETIMADLQLALNLYKEFKEKLNGVHPTVLNIIKMLF